MAIAYFWKEILSSEKQKYFTGDWMKSHILENHGLLGALYKAHEAGDEEFEDGDFRSEGDSPAFLHAIPTGLRSMESPGFGGWGGRYTNVRGNTWLDPVPDSTYQYPEGRIRPTNYMLDLKFCGYNSRISLYLVLMIFSRTYLSHW